jgi:large subunit ribosomal protein L25
MNSVHIQGTVRTEMGTKFAKALRAEGQVPCVIYGGEAPIHFSAPILSFRSLVYVPEVNMAVIELDGAKYEAVIQDMQFDVLKDTLNHIDFIQVIPGKPVTVEVPVQLTGNAAGVRLGGKMKIVMRKVKVKGLVSEIPGAIEHNVTALKIGESLRVNQIKEGKPFEILTQDSGVIATIKTTRNVVLGATEEEETEEAEA